MLFSGGFASGERFQLCAIAAEELLHTGRVMFGQFAEPLRDSFLNEPVVINNVAERLERGHSTVTDFARLRG